MKQIIDAPDDPNSSTPVIQASNATSLTPDGNNVDLEAEMGQLSRNKLMYNVTNQLIAAKFRQLTTVVQSQG